MADYTNEKKTANKYERGDRMYNYLQKFGTTDSHVIVKNIYYVHYNPQKLPQRLDIKTLSITNTN